MPERFTKEDMEAFIQPDIYYSIVEIMERCVIFIYGTPQRSVVFAKVLEE